VPLDSKHTARGRNRRIALVRQHGFIAIDRWLCQRHGTGIGADDLLDACVCAIVARDSTERIPRGPPEIDVKGLRMEMWF
jgi:predicted RNase H-like nuclease